MTVTCYASDSSDSCTNASWTNSQTSPRHDCNVLRKRQFCVKNLVRFATWRTVWHQAAFHFSMACCGFRRPTTHII